MAEKKPSDHGTKATSNHQLIQQWVEDRGGRPASVKGTGAGDEPGVLRINFPNYGDEESLHEISWEEFFEKFDEKKLAFLYQEQLRSGETSRFFKFVSQDTAKNSDAQWVDGPQGQAQRSSGRTSQTTRQSESEEPRSGSRGRSESAEGGAKPGLSAQGMSQSESDMSASGKGKRSTRNRQSK